MDRDPLRTAPLMKLISHTPKPCESQLGEFMAEMLGKIHTFHGIALACDRARERFVLPADESSEY